MAKLPFPRHLEIKGATWRVKLRKGLKDDGEPCSGLTDVNARTITLDSSLTEAALEWVFWHEHMHAVLHESGTTGNTGGISDLAEEIICDNYADAQMRLKIKWKRIKKPRA
jgi:Zn-dependent peptidase ImmA (M78 family)